MRQILMTVLLIMTVIAIYRAVAQGSDGTDSRVRANGTAMADGISRISP